MQVQKFANTLLTDKQIFVKKISEGLSLGKVLIVPWHGPYTDKPRILQDGNQVCIRKAKVWKAYHSPL